VHRLFIPLVSSLIFSNIYGQDTFQNHRLNGIGISYYGENISHYGLKIATEFPVLVKDKLKVKDNDKIINKRKEIFITGNIGGYVHKRNHLAVFIGSEIGYRKTRKKGFKYEFLLGLGYLHTFLQGDTYEVSDDGDVKKVNFAGQSNLMIPFSLGFGYDFNFFYKKPISVSIKPGFFIQYPYNIAVAVRPTIDFGIYYYFN
jgi:hypothetical protein